MFQVSALILLLLRLDYFVAFIAVCFSFRTLISLTVLYSGTPAT